VKSSFVQNRYELKALLKGNLTEWDNFITSSPQYCIFSTSFWLETIAESFSHEGYVLGCYKGGELVGGIPIFEKRTLEGKSAVYPLFTQYNGIHIRQMESRYPYRNEAHVHAIETLIAEYLEHHFDYVTIVNHPQLTDIRPFQWRNWDSVVRYTYLIHLDRGISLSADIKRRSNMARERGVQVECSADFNGFYNLLTLTYHKQNILIPLSRKNFLLMIQRLRTRNALVMYAAFDSGGSMLAANINILDGTKVYYWMAATDPTSSASGGNQLLIDETLSRLRANFWILDLAGADIPSIANYKSTLGGILVPHFQISKANSLRASIIKSLRTLKRRTVNSHKKRGEA
jgi:hypothetical protein